MHKHNYNYTGSKGNILIFRCDKLISFDKRCDSQVEREATKEEYDHITKNLFSKDIDHNVHFVSHQFQDILNKYKGEERENKLQELKNKYPDYIDHSNCDDDMFMSADVYYVQHKTPTKIMGVSVYIITQQDTVLHYFLYPGHLESMYKTLRKLREEYTETKWMYSNISKIGDKIKYDYND